jgi:hypothetical protein
VFRLLSVSIGTNSNLMVPIATAINQLKGPWFCQGRPLTDFPLFDWAKGLHLVAIKLLWSLPQILTLGACLPGFFTHGLITSSISLHLELSRFSSSHNSSQSVDNHPGPRNVACMWSGCGKERKFIGRCTKRNESLMIVHL